MPILFATREMPISHRAREHLTPARLAIIKHADKRTRTSEDVDAGVLLRCCFGCKMVPLFRNQCDGGSSYSYHVTQ